MEQLGTAIRYIREKQKMTPAALARKAELSASTIAAIESGKQSPSMKTTEQIADALGVRPIHIVMVAEDLGKKQVQLNALARAQKDLIDAALELMSQEETARPKKRAATK